MLGGFGSVKFLAGLLGKPKGGGGRRRVLILGPALPRRFANVIYGTKMQALTFGYFGF